MDSVSEKHCGIYCIDRIENVDKYKSVSCLYCIDKMQILSFIIVYKFLLAVLILIAVWVTNDLFWVRCLLTYVALVAIYGGITSCPTIILKQGAPALVALIYSFVLL